jgi:ribose/xylose/arabinose/galactoside ABC-type transport system permease subunit
MNVSSFVQQILIGLILVAAVAVDQRANLRR